MVFGASVCVAPDAVEHFDDGTHHDVERRLLTHLARERGLQRLAELDNAAGQAPLALERLVPALDQQHAIAVENHGADGDDRPVGVVPQILNSSDPQILKSLRSLRSP